MKISHFNTAPFSAKQSRRKQKAESRKQKWKILLWWEREEDRGNDCQIEFCLVTWHLISGEGGEVYVRWVAVENERQWCHVGFVSWRVS
jgi:hypothetical protein